MTDGYAEAAEAVEGPPLVADDGGVRWITFNRPSVLNALRAEDLLTVIDAVETAGDADAIVVTGAGDRAFSAGLHVDTFVEAGPDDGRALITRVADCIRAVRFAPVPTVAMVNGYCLGAAFELALACDLRTAVPAATFGLPEVRLGIPSVIEAALLPRHVGWSKAVEITLTGDLYAVADLDRYGIVNAVAAADDLREVTAGLLGRVTRNGREVIAGQKRVFRAWLDTGLQEAIDRSIDVFADVFRSPATTQAIARYRAHLGRRDASS